MENFSIHQEQFLKAVSAIDSGDIDELEILLAQNPGLIKERLQANKDGYFKDPYLLWFIADNPIRVDKLPANITDIARLLILAVKREAPDAYIDQVNYTLGLVATGQIVRECGVQIALMDLLIDAGAKPGNSTAALANSNIGAARHLLNRGGQLTLLVAVCLGLMDDIGRLGATATAGEKLTALTAAAFYGKADMIKLLLRMGANPNGYPENGSGFHSHATPLHQAVQSASLDAVKLLVEAGAKPEATDKVYDGTPLGWALHLQSEAGNNEAAKQDFKRIAAYLRERV